MQGNKKTYRYRESDNITQSQIESYVSIRNDLSGKSIQVLDTLKEHGPATYHTLCKIMTLQMNTITSRLNDLFEKGYVEIVGREYNPSTKRYNSVYKALDIPKHTIRPHKFKEHAFTESESKSILDRQNVFMTGKSVSFDNNGIAELVFPDLKISGITEIRQDSDALVFISSSATAKVRIIKKQKIKEAME